MASYNVKISIAVDEVNGHAEALGLVQDAIQKLNNQRIEGRLRGRIVIDTVHGVEQDRNKR